MYLVLLDVALEDNAYLVRQKVFFEEVVRCLDRFVAQVKESETLVNNTHHFIVELIRDVC